ncbi:MATE family efflux transporter [Sedimentibacter sp. MB31-C6]|uniref:MATE family efflux transporter n=1 Tax=Sedimentibacter sp. MB31-C6 TaxID=3109366 RepID=UPI002DDC9EF1|nr:MATE family efflux transporter [Sedimentibacter sp. MB36-C1]WSI03195.1 MATE family efflux transporter [Sedimentibacter sp. MB36-C1]
MIQNKSELIQKGGMYKVLLTLSIPIMINSIIQTLYNLVDGIWVSKISSVHFAATSFVWPINFLFVALGIGLSVAGTSLLSQLLGAGKYKEAKEYTTQLMVSSFLLSIAFTIVGFITSPYIIKLMGGEGEFANLANIYLRITFLDLPFMFLYFNINSIMNAQGNTVTPTILSAISALLNVALDPVLIFTLNMGIEGAAWATVLSRMVLALLGVRIILKEDNALKPNFRGFKVNKNILKEIVRVGLPASIGQAGASIGFMFLNGFIVSYGTATMAAFGMVNRVTSLVMQPAMGVGAALTAVVGQNLGANQLDRATESFIKASKIALCIGSIGGTLIFIFNKQMVDFFIQSKDEPEVIIQSMTYMKYVAFSMPLMGMFSVFQGIFQGSGNTKYSMSMEVGRLWAVRLPMILIFKNFSNFGASGIWFSMSFSNLIVCLYGLLIYKTHGWKRKTLIE